MPLAHQISSDSFYPQCLFLSKSENKTITVFRVQQLGEAVVLIFILTESLFKNKIMQNANGKAVHHFTKIPWKWWFGFFFLFSSCFCKGEMKINIKYLFVMDGKIVMDYSVFYYEHMLLLLVRQESEMHHLFLYIKGNSFQLNTFPGYNK